VADANLFEEWMIDLGQPKRSSEEGLGSDWAKKSSEVAIRALARNLNGKRGAIWPIALWMRARDEAPCQLPRG
jgi:hypothetical protein